MTKCVEKKHPGPAIVPVSGSLYYHDISMILTGVCGIISMIGAFIVIWKHSTCYSNPLQQRQIIRIFLLVPWVAIFCFLICWQQSSSKYLVEALDFGCSIALSGFLLMLCDFILSHPDGHRELFGDGEWREGESAPPTANWLKRYWFIVLQYIPSVILIWIGTAISLSIGTYCATSNSPKYAHIWISLLKLACTTAAVIAVALFYRRMKKHLRPHNVWGKFFAFKGIIWLNVAQSFLLNIIVNNGGADPTETMTYSDWIDNFPSLLLSCELPFFVFALFLAFPIRPYASAEKRGSAFKAIFDALNITDLFLAFVKGPMRMLKEQERKLDIQEHSGAAVTGGHAHGATAGKEGVAYEVEDKSDASKSDGERSIRRAEV